MTLHSARHCDRCTEQKHRVSTDTPAPPFDILGIIRIPPSVDHKLEICSAIPSGIGLEVHSSFGRAHTILHHTKHRFHVSTHRTLHETRQLLHCIECIWPGLPHHVEQLSNSRPIPLLVAVCNVIFGVSSHQDISSNCWCPWECSLSLLELILNTLQEIRLSQRDRPLFPVNIDLATDVHL